MRRDSVLQGLPAPALFKVLALPCRFPGRLHWIDESRWAVLEIEEAAYSEIDGLVDFREGTVIFHGPPREACAFLRSRGLPVPANMSSERVRIAGDWEEASAGDHEVALCGNYGAAEAGDRGLAYANQGTAAVGKFGVAVAHFGLADAGEWSLAAAWSGEATAGDWGLAASFCSGRARAGHRGVAVTGSDGRAQVDDEQAVAVSRGGTAVAGEDSIALSLSGREAVAGYKGLAVLWGRGRDGARARAYNNGMAMACPGAVAAAGDDGVVVVQYLEGRRLRLAVGYVGESGIKPGVFYGVDANGNLVERSP